MEYINQFIYDIFILTFTLIWIISFVFWTAQFIKIFLGIVLEIRRNKKTKFTNYENV